MEVCAHKSAGTHEVQRRSLYALEPELQEVVNWQVWCWELNCGPTQELHKLSPTEPFLQPWSYLPVALY